MTTPIFLGKLIRKHCGWPINKVERLLKDDPDVLALWRKMLTPPVGNNQHSEGSHVVTTLNGSSHGTPQHKGNKEPSRRGTRKAYNASRLKRECPDQFKRVEAGELSVYAAAVEAGFIQRTSTVPDNLKKAVDCRSRKLKGC